MTSSVQQDLSEFLLPCQQDLLPPVNTSTPTTTEYENETFNLTLNPAEADSSNTNTQPASAVFQDLTFQNLDSDNLDNFLVSNNNNLRSSNEAKQHQDNTMHSSLPSMILHSGHVMDYNQTCYLPTGSSNGTAAAGKNAHPEAFAMRKIKVSKKTKKNTRKHYRTFFIFEVFTFCLSCTQAF